MPIYEYRCGACGDTSSFFVRAIGNPVEARCSRCQSRQMERVVSAFAYHKSHSTLQGSHGPGAPSLDYYKDPRNIGRHVEGTFERYGVDMPDSVRDTIDAARDGHAPPGLDL